MNLTDFLDEHRIPYRRAGEHHHVTAGRIGIDCPYCSPGSGRFRFGIKENPRRFSNCWICGFKSTIDALMEAAGIPFQEVKDALGGIDEEEPKAKPRGKLILPSGLGPMKKQHQKYLRKRGFDPKEISKKWEVGGIGIAASHSWRLFIPIHDVDGRMVSWTTRAIRDGDEPRYLGAKAEQEEIDKKSLLYGEAFARHAIAVVEGPTDAWKIGPGAVATMGIVVTKSQVSRMAAFPTRLIVFDNEKDAQRRAEELCRELEPYAGVTYNLLLDSKDPGSATEKEIQQIRRMLE